MNKPKLKVKVRKKHIENGKVQDSRHCMIADAIHDADPEARYVSVDLQSIAWSHLAEGKRFIAFTPAKAQTALLEFDSGIKPNPFMFTAHCAVVRKVGWQANHPGKSRVGKVYRQTGLKRRKPRRFRQFGIKMFLK